MKRNLFIILIITIFGFVITSCKIFSFGERQPENEVNVTFKEPGTSTNSVQQNPTENQTGTPAQTNPTSNKPAGQKEPPKGLQPAL